MPVSLDLSLSKLDEHDLEDLNNAAKVQVEQQRMTLQEFADTLTKLNEYGVHNGLSYGNRAANTTDEDEDIADGI